MNNLFELRDDGKLLVKVLDKTVKKIVIPNSVTKIGVWAFKGCTSLESIDIPNSVTSIGKYAFEGCTSLESIDIPNSVTKIDDSAFEDCTSLESIDIPNSVTEIGDSAFKSCTSLKSVDIPNSVTEIGDSAFEGCFFLESIDIPNSVTEIGKMAFFRSYSLRSIDIPKSVKTIGNQAFGHTNIKKIFIPLSVNSIKEHALCHCPLSAIEVDKDNPIYYSQDGVLYKRISAKNSILIKYPPHKRDNSFSVNETTIKLESCAFKGAEELSEIVLHNGISSLGDQHTFAHCSSLKKIELPTLISRIPREAFYYCTSLEEVFLPNSEKYAIEENVFSRCSSLKSIHSAAQNPDGIKIDNKAFDGFNIDECTLYIPSGTRWAYRHHPGFGKFKNIEIEKK